MYEGICDAIHHELERLDEKYDKGGSLNAEELVDIDRMFHALKCLKTYEAMAEYPRGRSKYSSREYENRRY